MLTPHSEGGSLTEGAAGRELGEGKRIYIAGCFAEDGCLTNTAEELSKHNHEIRVIEEATLVIIHESLGPQLLSTGNHKALESFNVDDIRIITLDEVVKALVV